MALRVGVRIPCHILKVFQVAFRMYTGSSLIPGSCRDIPRDKPESTVCNIRSDC